MLRYVRYALEHSAIGSWGMNSSFLHQHTDLDLASAGDALKLSQTGKICLVSAAMTLGCLSASLNAARLHSLRAGGSGRHP